MSNWEDAVKALFATHPPAMSAQTVITAIKNAATQPGEYRSFAETQFLLDGITEENQIKGGNK